MKKKLGEVLQMGSVFYVGFKSKRRNFTQLFIDGRIIELRSISEGEVKNTIVCDITVPNQILMFLNIQTNPIDIIIKTDDMSCKNIDTFDIDTKDIDSFVQNRMLSSSGMINTVLYEKDKKTIFGSFESVSLCEMNIDTRVANFLEKVFKLKNCVKNITSWPVWIVRNYFAKFPSEEHKFKCSIFVSKYRDNYDITAYYQGSVVCYRQYTSQMFDEHNEIESVMKYVSQKYKISLEYFSIYNINEETLLILTNPDSSEMKFLSSICDITSEKSSVISFKTCMKATLCAVLTILILQARSIVNMKSKLEEGETILNSVENTVYEEKQLWSKINDNVISNIDFVSILSDVINNTEKSTLKYVSFSMIPETKEVRIDMTPSLEAKSEYTKEITTSGYKFFIEVSKSGIICHGKC